MTTRSLTKPQSDDVRSTKLIMMASNDAMQTGSKPPVLRRRKGSPKLASNAKLAGGIQALVIRHKGKSLTLFQWSRRTRCGLKPVDIWRRLRAGFPLEEALGGSAAVRRAVSFVSVKERKAAKRRAKLLAKHQPSAYARLLTRCKRRRGRHGHGSEWE